MGQVPHLMLERLMVYFDRYALRQWHYLQESVKTGVVMFGHLDTF
jgi:hypothetical protein